MKGSPSTTSFGFSRKSIINEVERICKSEHFANSKQLQDFLRYLINETLAGRKSQIKAYSIATEVFGRDKNFNPDIDPIVRVEARRLRKKLIENYIAQEKAAVFVLTFQLVGMSLHSPSLKRLAVWSRKK